MSVIDEGVGMTPEQLSRAGEPRRGATATLRLPPERVVQSARRARLRLASR